MKTVFTSHEIAHVWAHKSAPHGKSPSAMSFNGGVIYSYSTAMARHITHKGKSAIIYNATSYSVSTAKHQGRIRTAIHGLTMPVFRIDGLRRGEDLRWSGDDLFKHYLEASAQALKDAEKPRIRPHTIDAHKARAVQFLEQAKAVSEFFGLRKKVDEKAIARLAKSKAAAEKRERIAREKAEKAQRAEYESAFEDWKKGVTLANGQSAYFPMSLFPVAFRIEGDELVSTLGARVPLAMARLAYRFVTSKRGQQWRENGETCKVGMYRINSICEAGIVAGCHRITWAEMERLAPVLGGAQ